MLRAETLSRKLNTTKGSFYWHFKDVPEFHAAILDTWSQQARTALAETLPVETPPAARLRELCQHIAHFAGSGPATALRGWTRDSAMARDTLSHIDDLCRARLDGLLAETGITNPEMTRILHAAAIGMAQLPDADEETNTSAIGSLVDLILALR